MSPLTVALPDGTPASIVAKAAYGTFGIVNRFPDNLINGSRIQAQDLSIEIAADIPKPEPGWKITIGGRDYSVVNVEPTYIRQTVVKYDVQAR